MKPIRLSTHALEQVGFRGASVAQVEEAIRSAEWHDAELGRNECRKDFAFNAVWNGRHYAAMQIRPIFVEEDEIVVVTVYVYYF